jgi:hypothetical protein
VLDRDLDNFAPGHVGVHGADVHGPTISGSDYL